MPVKRDWVLYGGDSVDMSSVKTDNVFFDETETAAGNGVNETNMPLAGQLPKDWSMEVHGIHVYLDQTELAATSLDACSAVHGAIVEIKIAKKRVFIAPAKLCLGQGELIQAKVESNSTSVTCTPMGYKLKVPLTIPGATPFEVIFRTSITAATSATNEMQIALTGIMTMPE